MVWLSAASATGHMIIVARPCPSYGSPRVSPIAPALGAASADRFLLPRGPHDDGRPLRGWKGMPELEQELRHTRVSHERRRARRYRVDLPVEFEGGKGVTRNVSQTGVLFATDREAKIGDLVDFSLVLGERSEERRVGKGCR